MLSINRAVTHQIGHRSSLEQAAALAVLSARPRGGALSRACRGSGALARLEVVHRVAVVLAPDGLHHLTGVRLKTALHWKRGRRVQQVESAAWYRGKRGGVMDVRGNIIYPSLF